MMATIAMELIAQNDARLVAESLKGNREAFGEIVSRFHTLIWMPMGVVIWQVLRLRKQRRQRQLAKEGGAQ